MCYNKLMAIFICIFVTMFVFMLPVEWKIQFLRWVYGIKK